MANEQRTVPAVGTGDAGQSTPTTVVETAGAEASNVASTAVDGARDVADEVTTQAKAVAGEAREQIAGLVNQGGEEIRHQAEQRTAQLVDQLRSLSAQVTALAEGRPEAGGSLVGYLDEARSRILGLASRLEQRGVQGVVDDVSGFARRRPGVFLTGAVAAGFLVGRTVRAAVATQQDSTPEGTWTPAADGPVRYRPAQSGSLSPADPGLRP